MSPSEQTSSGFPGVLPRGEALSLALNASLSLALTLGSFDLMLSVLRRAPSALATFATILPPLAVSSAAFFIMIAPILAAAALLPYRDPWPWRGPLIVALIVTLGAGLLLALYFNLVRLEPGANAPTMFSLVACLSVALGAHAGVLARTRRRAPDLPRATGAAIISLPILMGMACLVAWGWVYAPTSIAAGSPHAWIAGFALGGFVVASLCVRFSARAPAGRLLAALSALLVLGAAGTLLRGDAPAARPSSRPAGDRALRFPKILFLSIDTLRFDAVSALDAGAPPTPALDALANDSVIFTHAYAPAPWTLASFVSMMTGVSPGVHGVKSPEQRIPDSLPTLAERLRDAGYVTAAIGHNPWLRPEHGMARGFADYDICPRDERGASVGSRLLARLFPARLKPTLTTDELSGLASAWLRRHAQDDFFLWLHYFKPHGPYQPPSRYRPSEPPPPGMGYSFGGAPEIRMGSLVVPPEGRLWARSLYQAEVRFVDDNVGRVLGEMKRLGIYDDTLIIFVSDHGEEFWEHGSFEHGHTLYQELIRVPFFVKLPGRRFAGRRDQEVSTGSISPTLLQLMRLPVDPEAFSYQPLGPLLGEGGNFHERPLVSSAPLYYDDREALISAGMKYIRTLVSGEERLFDLIDDPFEHSDLASKAPDRVRKARGILAEERDADAALRWRYGILGRSPAQLNPESLQQLRSLGYVR